MSQTIPNTDIPPNNHIRNLISGESRISQGRGANPKGGTPTYYLANFSQKMHENEEILGRGGRVPRAPPLDPPLLIFIHLPHVLNYFRHPENRIAMGILRTFTPGRVFTFLIITGLYSLITLHFMNSRVSHHNHAFNNILSSTRVQFQYCSQ